MKKEYVIPVFVPHLGCPNDCIFCNQKSISGQKKNITKEDVKNTIEYYLKNIKDKEGKKEIAFFGGSFTGIDVKIQEELLQVAYEYIKNGQVHSIRISTRPDYIDKEILKRLKINPYDKEAYTKRMEMESFFMSRWFAVLTDLNPTLLMGKLKNSIEKINSDN